MRCHLVLAGLVAGVGMSLATPALAQGNASLVVSPSAVAPGQAVTFAGHVDVASGECRAGDTLFLTSASALFSPDGRLNATLNSAGDFSTRFQVSSHTPPATYSVGLRCGGGNLGVEETLRITSQVTEVPSGAAQTGDGGAAGAEGLNLLIAGGLALVAAGVTSVGAVTLRRSGRP